MGTVWLPLPLVIGIAWLAVAPAAIADKTHPWTVEAGNRIMAGTYAECDGVAPRATIVETPAHGRIEVETVDLSKEEIPQRYCVGRKFFAAITRVWYISNQDYVGADSFEFGINWGHGKFGAYRSFPRDMIVKRVSYSASRHLKMGQRELSAEMWNCDYFPKVEIVQKPAHGTLGMATVTSVVSTSAAAACQMATVPGIQVWYTPDPQYAGTDEFVVRSWLISPADSRTYVEHVVVK